MNPMPGKLFLCSLSNPIPTVRRPLEYGLKIPMTDYLEASGGAGVV
jgi:hypothetical protein